MKKSFLLIAALALVLVGCEKKEDVKPVKVLATVSSFEDISLQPESVLHLDPNDDPYFKSGDCYFMQDVADYTELGYGIIYSGNVVSNKTSKTYEGDYDNDKCITGKAHSGNNFVVWTTSYSNLGMIVLPERAQVPGFYVNNTPWVVDAILNGDGMSQDGDEIGLPFGANDYFTLEIYGLLVNEKAEKEEDQVKVAGKIEFDLARGTSYVQDWTYVALSKLGEVDAIQFNLVGSKHNASGLTTPAYFCYDDFGAKE